MWSFWVKWYEQNYRDLPEKLTLCVLPISYHFWNKRRCRLKIVNFPHFLCIYHPHWGSSPWNCVTAVALKTIRVMPTRRWKDFDYVCICSDTIPRCDGQTDGQKCWNNIALFMLTRDKEKSDRMLQSSHQRQLSLKGLANSRLWHEKHLI